MKTYRQNFKKTVWGYIYTNAESEEEAREQFENDDYDEFDNKSDYEFEDEIYHIEGERK